MHFSEFIFYKLGYISEEAYQANTDVQDYLKADYKILHSQQISTNAIFISKIFLRLLFWARA